MGANEQVLIEKIRKLPPRRQAEVEDFVDFLRTLDKELCLVHTAAKASEESFAVVWNNEEDAVYDRI